MQAHSLTRQKLEKAFIEAATASYKQKKIALIFKAALDVVAVFEQYIDRILAAKQRFNLIGTSDLSVVIEKHVIDSLVGATHFPKSSQVADVGSGAGFPGIPLSLVLPKSHFTLIESNSKKANFLLDVKKNLDLSNVEVLCQNVTEVRKSFGIITIRALYTIEKALKQTRRMSVLNTQHLFYKGKKDVILEELKPLSSPQGKFSYKNEVIPLWVSSGQYERHMVRLWKWEK